MKNKTTGTAVRQLANQWEKFLIYTEILLSYLQFLSIIGSIDVSWPSLWTDYVSWLDFVKLAVTMDLPGLPRLDFRVHYLIVTVMLPTAFCFIFLIFFRRKRVVIWYTSLLAGIGAFIAGICIILLPFVNNYTNLNGYLTTVTGGVAVVLCTMSFFWYRNRRRISKLTNNFKSHLRMHRTENTDENPLWARSELAPVALTGFPQASEHPVSRHSIDIERSKHSDPNEGEHSSRIPGLTRSDTEKAIDIRTEQDFTIVPTAPKKTIPFIMLIFLLCGGFTVFGLYGIGALVINDYPMTAIIGLGEVVGRVLLIIAALFLIYLILILTERGRQWLDNSKAFLKAHVLNLTLFLLVALYIPTTNNLVAGFLCVEKTCEAGTRFPKLALSPLPQITPYSSHSGDVCTPCTFLGICNHGSKLCPAVTDWRLAADVHLSCNDIKVFLWPVSSLLLAGFTLGIPIMFFILTRKHGDALSQIDVLTNDYGVNASDYDRKVSVNEDFNYSYDSANEKEKWKRRLWLTRNSAKSLYMAFHDRFRYFNLVRLIHKLTVVMCAGLLMRFPFILSIITLSLHFCFLVLLLFTRPYISLSQEVLSIVSFLCLSVTTILPLLLSLNVTVPAYAVMIVLIADILIPLLSFGASKYYIYRKEKAKELSEVSEMGTALWKTSTKTVGVTKAVDRNLNDFTLKVMTKFFLILGVVAFLSFILVFIGVLYSDYNQNVVGYEFVPPTDSAKFESSAKEFQFLDYASWDDFVDNCCCMLADLSGQDERVVLMEQWTCLSGKEKLRLRKEIGPSASGLDARGPCSNTFVTPFCTDPQYKTVEKLGRFIYDRHDRILAYPGWTRPEECSRNTTLSASDFYVSNFLW